MEKFFCYVLGVLGSFISCVHGKCDIPLRTLILFMVIDYISGIMIAVFFKKSPKSEKGTLKSDVGLKGICKKGMMLIYVFVGVHLDILMNNDYIGNTICIGFIVNELISIIENAGIMGIPMPTVLKNIIDILNENG